MPEPSRGERHGLDVRLVEIPITPTVTIDCSRYAYWALIIEGELAGWAGPYRRCIEWHPLPEAPRG